MEMLHSIARLIGFYHCCKLPELLKQKHIMGGRRMSLRSEHHFAAAGNGQTVAYISPVLKREGYKTWSDSKDITFMRGMGVRAFYVQNTGGNVAKVNTKV